MKTLMSLLATVGLALFVSCGEEPIEENPVEPQKPILESLQNTIWKECYVRDDLDGPTWLECTMYFSASGVIYNYKTSFGFEENLVFTSYSYRPPDVRIPGLGSGQIEDGILTFTRLISLDEFMTFELKKQ